MNHVGRQIGRYRILELLGSGGMSVVYKGLDTTLEREVAVKVLHPHLAVKEESRLRLAREARAVARLHHPNILEVFDYSDREGSAEDSEAYLVTEYIRGKTLRVELEERPLALPELGAMIVHTLASALAQAHEAGIIHRDLKPENVMVREDGVLKVMDFGIAKVLDRDERMTMTGALVGSPAHMAPEIIEGLDATAASDVFSLGTILFSLVTGKLPFTASNATATLKRILDGVYPDPRQLSASVSDGLAEVIAKSLARQPAERYHNASELRDALGAYLAELGISRVPEELSAHFRDPQQYLGALRARLVDTLMQRGEALLQEGRQARALSAINHVLAIEERHPKALAMLERMKVSRARQKRREWLRRSAGIALGVLLLAAGTSWLAWRVPAQMKALVAETPASPSGTETPAVVAPVVEVKPEPVQPVPTTIPPEAEPPIARTDPVKDVRPSVRVPITVLVRPYGRIQLDGGAPTALLQRHSLKIAPGTHRVRITCELCEDVEETIEVRARGENVFHLRAQPRPSQVTFSVEPKDALVRIGDEARSAASSQTKPFVVRAPRGATSFQQQLEAEISHPGFASERHTVRVEAGRSNVVSVRLRPLTGPGAP